MVNNASNAMIVVGNFIENPTKITISEETKALIDRLLLERISLAGIARVAQVSEKWLQDYVIVNMQKFPDKWRYPQKKKGKLTLQQMKCVFCRQ